jgi:hypothetical protein
MVNDLTNKAIDSIKKYYGDDDMKSLIELAEYMVGREK